MPVFDLNKYQDDDKLKDNAVAATNDQLQQQSQQETNTNANNDIEEAGVIISGPLSKVYAEALHKVFEGSKVAAIESTSQMAGMILYMGGKLAGGEIESQPAVVYVDDGKNMDENTNQSFDGLRLALDQKGRKYVVFENLDGSLNNKTGLVVEHAIKYADKVFYSREAFMNFIKPNKDEE